MKNVGSVLPISVYPHIEQLLGYDGTHRFVIFDTKVAHNAHFYDGTLAGECAPDGWQSFIGHPRIAPLLPQAHLTNATDEYCLLLDREKRQFFSFQKETAVSLLQSDKNRYVASTAQLVEKLEGLFSLRGNLEPCEKKGSATGTTEHFLSWMATHK